MCRVLQNIIYIYSYSITISPTDLDSYYIFISSHILSFSIIWISIPIDVLVLLLSVNDLFISRYLQIVYVKFAGYRLSVSHLRHVCNC
jgi:hypothetical protein